NRLDKSGQTASWHVDHSSHVKNFVKTLFLSAESYRRWKQRGINAARLPGNKFLNLLPPHPHPPKLFWVPPQLFHGQIESHMDRPTQSRDGYFFRLQAFDGFERRLSH